MTKYNFSDVQAPDSWTKIISGSFQCNTSSDPVVTTGTGWSVVHTGTGTYTITLDAKIGQLISVVAGEQHAGDVDTVRASVTAVDVDARTIGIVTVTGASGAARPAADLGTGVVVNFVCIYRSTKVQP